MFKAPKIYETSCSSKNSGAVIFDRVYEAINKDEAAARAWLNCVKEYNHPGDISITVNRVLRARESASDPGNQLKSPPA